jgi:phosphoserine phosphatase RsbU/P
VDAREGVTKLRFYHRYLPTTMMGGDFFHIARLSDDTAGICICDVMGHGVRAALITAMLRALRSQRISAVRSYPQFAEQRNQKILQ